MGTLSNVFGKKSLTPDEKRLQKIIDTAVQNSPIAKKTIEDALAKGVVFEWDKESGKKITWDIAPGTRKKSF